MTTGIFRLLNYKRVITRYCSLRNQISYVKIINERTAKFDPFRADRKIGWNFTLRKHEKGSEMKTTRNRFEKHMQYQSQFADLFAKRRDWMNKEWDYFYIKWKSGEKRSINEHMQK